ncbi:MAG: hypothetical protein FWF09_06930, partial [Bacteroidales bacterium]|nr:hypothetical protein [Bacteroidales bacterium]
QTAANCKISLGHSLRGNIDEVRFWNRALSETEITRDYSRRLVGNENGLRGYWTFDENLADYAFDMSRIGATYNGNHATTNTLIFDTNVPDETYQLALKGITDPNGNYQISGIPFTGEGTSYSIVPSLGVHVFNPTEHLRYISPTSMVHNATDFTDISSFTVSGIIMYEGGNYPVAGCSFEIDNQPVTLSNGQLVTSDYNGNFSISVPIGKHTVRVVKQGHIFAGNGYLKDEITGENINYNAPLSDIKFYDQTRVKLIGRVVGGLTENNKVLGFGESKNNIGTETITLETTQQKYDFVSNPVSATFYHNQGQWKKPGTLSNDQTTVTYNQKNITIQVSPLTGEFVAYVYPEPYNLGEIKVPAAGDELSVYSNNEMINLTPAAVPDDSYMKTEIRTWTDSTFVANQPGVVDHWEYFEKSDTVRYHEKWTYYYQATPTFSVQQLVNNEPVDYFGDKTYMLKDDLTGENETLTLYNNDAYLFEKPVFRQGTRYRFLLNAYEEYSNYISDPVETIRYPVKEGRVNMYNDIRLNPQPETIEMNENGETIYEFLAGTPNLTTGANNFFATLTIGSISYNWDLTTPVTDPVAAWHLGDKSTGTDFMTSGPDEITAILRDPPGSRSKSYIETGTTITIKKSNTIVDGLTESLNVTTSLGPKVKTFIGFCAGVIIESEVKTDVSAGIKAEQKWTSNSESSTTTTFTERFETSDDPLYVGHYGDLFIGNSTNILYGLTNGITIIKNYANEDDDAFETIGDYSIAPSVSIAYGQTFNTRFAFTEVDIEEIMIPKWKDALKILLKPMGTPVNPEIITTPVYVSQLSYDDPNFGKLNTDKTAFGDAASNPLLFHDGPSYKIHFPINFDLSEFTTDSVMHFNNQINGWIAVLTQNEKEKVQMSHLGNYSFGSGVSIEYSKTNTATENVTSTFNWVLNPTIGLVAGFDVMGIGMEIETNFEYVHEEETSTGTETETTITSGFILQEEGDDDQITVDYGMTSSGTIAFKTRGGRTSCPYEDGLITKYFEPGQHILMEATMQIEVPKIRVASAPMVLNVPANKEATFLLALENESETDEDVWFELIVDEYTNPYGATLRIDGAYIGNGRYFLVKAGETLYKTLTVGKGSADTYPNIGLILRSPCQSDPTVFLPVIADTTYISVEFIPGVSDVAIAEPRQQWILNADSPTGDTLYVTLRDFDVNFPNFGYIRLEYRPTTSPNWITIMTFYPSHLYPNAQGLKEDIEQRAQIVHPWKMPNADGPYEIRATVTSVNVDGQNNILEVISSYVTDAVTGYKDMQRPVSLGLPSPASGILGIGDELSITFNEDIQAGMLIPDN